MANYKDTFIPQSNYYISFEDKLNIIGKAKRNVIIDIGEEKKLVKKEVTKGIFAWPLDLTDESKLHYVINSCYGHRNCKPPCTTYTYGLDIKSNKGDAVYATADGTVEFHGNA